VLVKGEAETSGVEKRNKKRVVNMIDRFIEKASFPSPFPFLYREKRGVEGKLSRI
jgi:hypothetical protein